MHTATDDDMMNVAEILIGPSPPRPKPPAEASALPDRVRRDLAGELATIREMVREIEVPPMASPAPADKRPREAAAATAPEEPAPKKARRRGKEGRPDIKDCIQGDTFVDYRGQRFEKDEQLRRIDEWLQLWDQNARSSVIEQIMTIWRKHTTHPFDRSQLRYPCGDKTRYISSRGLCNGHEVKGFPVMEPVDTNPRGIITKLRFSRLLADRLTQRDARSKKRVIRRMTL